MFTLIKAVLTAFVTKLTKVFGLTPDLVEVSGYGDSVITTNKAAAFVADKITLLPSEDYGNDVCRVFRTHIDRSGTCNDKFYRRQAVTIVNQKTGEHIVRFVQGGNSRSSQGLTAHAVSLDYDATNALGINRMSDIEEHGMTFEVRPATGVELFEHFYNHYDLRTRMSTRHSVEGLQRGQEGKALGILGGILGFVGIVLGIFL